MKIDYLINELIKANNIDEWNGITIIFDNKHYMTQGISNELLEKLTGEKFNPKYYIEYLTNKFTKLYHLR